MPRVFISYRRDDAIAYAGRIYDRLSSHFGNHSVFMDIDTLDPGVDFVQALQQTVASCDVLLAVIGPQWAGPKSKGQSRLFDPDDFVSQEIAAALERRSTRVVPILVAGAHMPRPDELPHKLLALLHRHAFSLPDIGFQQTLNRLIESIEKSRNVG
jgi:hypothetical protein